MKIETLVAKRKYELKQRAERQAETRARIVAATAELHQEVGPAQTTVAEIARRAGVERATVYNHFPDEAALYGACQAHWLARTPPPDPSGHAAIDDPQERLEAVLRDLYAWYRRGQRMTRNVLRDAQVVPALARTLEARSAAMERTVALLLRGRTARGSRRRELEAALGLMLDFRTWEQLTGTGLDDEEAARLAAEMVAAI